MVLRRGRKWQDFTKKHAILGFPAFLVKLHDFHPFHVFLVEIRLFRPGRKKHQLNLCNSIGFLGARLGGTRYNPPKSRILWESAHFMKMRENPLKL